jgi:hypothetical protein
VKRASNDQNQEVIRTPPDDLVEQAGIDPATDRRRRAQSELALVMLRPGVRHGVRQVRLAHPFEADGRIAVGAAELDR